MLPIFCLNIFKLSTFMYMIISTLFSQYSFRFQFEAILEFLFMTMWSVLCLKSFISNYEYQYVPLRKPKFYHYCHDKSTFMLFYANK
jgi:hypothetical protein